MSDVARRLHWFWTERNRIAFATALVLSYLLLLAAQPASGQGVNGESWGLRIAADNQGQLWAVWTVDDGQDGDVYYSRWEDGGWMPSQPLSARPDVGERSASLAFAGDGMDAWAAWSASAGRDWAEIQVSRWTAGRWMAPEAVPGTRALRGDEPALATGPDGSLWLAWTGHDGTDREAYASRWDGRTWSDPQRVGGDDQDPMAYDAQPRLAVDPSGRAWLVWVSYEGSLNDEIHASHWDGTAWSPQQRVSALDETPDAGPAVLLDAEGLPWVAWHGVESELGRNWRIYLSHWDGKASAWSRESLVSSAPSLTVDERQPTLAFDAQNKLHLAWLVSGERSGIARTKLDGERFLPVTWLETGQLVDSPVLTAVGQPLVHWLVLGADGGAPIGLQVLEEITDPLPPAPTGYPAAPDQLGSVVPNRNLAHGDSITWGQYNDLDGQPATPYPVFLDGLLDRNAGPSEVINSGVPGELAGKPETRARLRQSVRLYLPESVLIMEGTNDLARVSEAETAWRVRQLIWAARDESGVEGVRVMIATLIPRFDDNNSEKIPVVNELLYTKVAQREKVPIADPWQAFMNYGSWPDLYVDHLHPGSKGLEIIANTFFQTMVGAGWIPQDPDPPSAWITNLPTKSGCFVPVNWTGDDGQGSGVASFDLQVRAGGGTWTDWLVKTPQFYGFYVSPSDQTLEFRVRARDNVGNVGAYSAPDATSVECNSAIKRIYLPALNRNAQH